MSEAREPSIDHAGPATPSDASHRQSTGIALLSSHPPSQGIPSIPASTHTLSAAASRASSSARAQSEASARKSIDIDHEFAPHRNDTQEAPLGPLPRLVSSAGSERTHHHPGGEPQVFAGTLFPSFDHEANYLAKQAELRALGYMEDESYDNTPSSSPGAGRGDEAPSGGKDTEGAEALHILERQIKRRDEMYIAAQRRADEAKEYAAMIAHLRAESKRADVVHRDVHSSLVAQVEALQYVVQRRNDADNLTAQIRFVDVEDEVLSVSKDVDDETDAQVKRMMRLGEESVTFVEQLSAQADSFVEELQTQQGLETELRETQELLQQQVGIRVTMLTDQLRSELVKSISSELRLRYLIPIGGGTLSADIRRLVSNYCEADVQNIVSLVCRALQLELQISVDAAFQTAVGTLPEHVDQTQRAGEELASATLQRMTESQAAALGYELRLAQQNIVDANLAREKRRSDEEATLRDVVLELGKLLESQRLAMNDLRTQLLLQAKAQAIAFSPPKRTKGDSSARAAQSQSPTAGKKASTSKGRHASPSSSRRLLFEPLTGDQIKSLYGALPTHATVVEEVSAERLSRLTAKALHEKKATPHQQDQLILISRTPASLMGRGATTKVTTTLTAAGANKSTAVASSTAHNATNSLQAPSKQARESGYTNGDLVTLQELRRLRVRIGPT